jgi:hypothetical protein
MSNTLNRLAREPAVLGGFATSILPALVVLNALSLNGEQTAAVVVLINATCALVVRLCVTPGKNPPTA